MKFDLIIFDCDGTLIDSESLYNKAFSKVLIDHGYVDYTYEKCMKEWAGIPYATVIKRLQIEHKDIKITEIHQAFMEKANSMLIEELEPVKGAHELLDMLTGVSKCVASNGEYETIKYSLEVTKLKKYFKDEHIFTYDKVGRAKPDPMLFLHAAEYFDVDPSKCLVIEDSIVGIQAAKSANMKVLLVEGSHKHFGKSLSEYCIGKINNLTQVMEYIK